MKTPPVLIVGAGLSGLATAWYLRERGARVHVIDAGAHPGGLIQTQHAPEGVVETAARGFTWSARTAALFEALGITPSFARDASTRRYIFRDGRPQRWPLTAFETAGFAARFAGAWLGRRIKPTSTENVAEWGARVVGRAATTWLLAPALQGIYASPAHELSAAALFGKRRGPRGKLGAPPGGMGELMDRLHDALARRGVTFQFGETVAASALDPAQPIVVCTSAPAAARLLAPHAPGFAAAVARIRMVSIVCATNFYTPHDADLCGFGILFPRSSGVRALGAVFNADVFEGRSPLRSETWIYGDLDAAALPQTGMDTAALIAADRRVLTRRDAAPIASYVSRHIEALPVYNGAVLDAQAALPSLPPRWAVAGNYLGRLGVSALLDGAADAADRIGRSNNRVIG